MHQHHVDPASLDLGRTVRDLGPAVTRWPLFIGIGGLVAALLFLLLRIALVGDGYSVNRFLFAYLHSFIYFLTIAIGALFFVMVQHLTRAGWSVTVRRVAEIMAANLWPTFALMFLPLLVVVWLGNGLLYPWTSPTYVAAHEIVEHKIGYFNAPWDRSIHAPLFFTLRAAIYFGIWYFLATSFYRRSLEQDATGEPRISQRLEGRGAWGIIVLFITATFAAIDWVMSLDPEWFSTMYGVYFIAGCAVSFFAALWVVISFIQSRGPLREAVTVEHQHDIGKFLFGFVVFWTYIAFCQYLLYWYGDIPEETRWYLVRQNGGWQWIGLLLIFGHFIIPFLGLMSRHVKRNRSLLLFWSVWVLVMHWFDILYLVMPQGQPALLPGYEALTHAGEAVTIAPLTFVVNLLMDLSMFVGVGGFVVAGMVRTAADHALVPVKDPRLAESLAFHNV